MAGAVFSVHFSRPLMVHIPICPYEIDFLWARDTKDLGFCFFLSIRGPDCFLAPRSEEAIVVSNTVISMNPSLWYLFFLKRVYCLFLSFTVIDILYAFKSGSPWGYINFSDLYRVVLLRFLYALIPCTKYNYNLDQFQFTIQSFSTLMQSSYGEIALSGLANITWLDAPPSRWAHRQLRLLRPARTLPRATEHYQTTFATGIRVYCLDFNPIWIFSGLCSIPKGPDRRRQKSFLPPT